MLNRLLIVSSIRESRAFMFMCHAAPHALPMLQSHLTEDYVKRARRHGVTVYAPDQPQPLPPPGSVHVVVVSRPHMERYLHEIPSGVSHI